MGGIILDQPLPNQFMDQLDPFLLIHHWNDRLKGNQKQNEAGVGPHPHRGFSPVTLIFKGGVHHRDSRGNNSIVMEGGTQWMFAGMGITHSERPYKELAEDGGEFELIQFWLNVPAKNKMEQPVYTAITKEDTPVFTSKDGKVKVGILSGNFKNLKGIVDHFSPVTVLRFDFEKEGEIEFEIPSIQNTLIYLLDGHAVINNEDVTSKDLVWFSNDGDDIKIKSNQTSRAILLSGEPIGEEVVSYGLFVMNNHTEIMEAMRDAQMGKMGVLIEE
ncbi:MAG: pirin family protein [Ignavibacteriaceae bacterium]|nr:pirin family protein [Ignavibacteriaceae bacterium]